ncbi:hypothetical protein [Streptomyces sp. NPDC014746]|uniref:hypothetical protein n=1 Tax=Streptomyces sp. NPDC014746 TaxID=3364904 RepID=UPI0036F940C8
MAAPITRYDIRPPTFPQAGERAGTAGTREPPSSTMPIVHNSRRHRAVGRHSASPRNPDAAGFAAPGVGADGDDTVLTDLAAVPGTASCGTDTSDEGRRVWAVVSTKCPGTRAAAV